MTRLGLPIAVARAAGAAGRRMRTRVLYSAAAQWYFHAPLVLQLRYDYAQTSASIKTNTLLIGLGYQFDSAAAPGPVPPSHYDLSTRRLEMTCCSPGSVGRSDNDKGAACPPWGRSHTRSSGSRSFDDVADG